MSHRRAKAERKRLKALGLDPPTGPGPNFTGDTLDDTREQRRTKSFGKKRYARDLAESSPAKNREHARKWKHVFLWLTVPDFREALGDPYTKRRLEDEAREAGEATEESAA